MPGGLSRSASRSFADDRSDLAHELVGDVRDVPADDVDLALEARVLDPVVQAAPLERVVHLAGAVRGQDDERRRRRPDRPQFRNGDGEVGEHLEQERLELVVGAVDLVDQQHGR